MENDKKIEYPQYTREQNLSCKLTTEQIQKIRDMYSNGYAQRPLAKLFKVSRTTIIYWLNDKYRENSIKRVVANIKKRKAQDPELFNKIQAQRAIKAKKRKKNTLSQQYKDWESYNAKKRYETKHDHILKMGRKKYKENYILGNKPKPWIKNKKKCTSKNCNNLIQPRNTYCKKCSNTLWHHNKKFN